MWRRVWGLASFPTLAWLAFVGCGKSERARPDESGGADVTTGGVTTATAGKSGSAGRAGSASSVGGEQTTTTGGAALAGGAALGGNTALGGIDGASGGETSSAGTSGAGEAGASGAPGCGTYQACGCGCCPVQRAVPTCFYPSLGQDLQDVIDADVAKQQDTAGCATVGCSQGQDFVCCEPPLPMDDGATYKAGVIIGGYDRIHLDKTVGNECSTFSFVSPTAATTQFPVETPASWAVESVTRLPCTSSMTKNLAIGAVGKLSLRVSGNACVLDAHLTAFFGNAAEGVTAERFDVEDLPVNISVGQCH